MANTGQKFLKAISAPGKDTVNRLVLRKAGMYDLSKKGQQVKATQILKSVHRGGDKIHGLSQQKAQHLQEREAHLIKYLHGRAVRSEVAHESARAAVHEFHADIKEAARREEQKKLDEARHAKVAEAREEKESARTEKKEEEERAARMEANRKALRRQREIEDAKGGGSATSALRKSRSEETSSAIRSASRSAKSSAAQVSGARTSALGPKTEKPKEMMI